MKEGWGRTQGRARALGQTGRDGRGLGMVSNKNKRQVYAEQT